MAFEVLVVGGDLNGLASLYRLLRLGGRDVGLAEPLCSAIAHSPQKGASHATQ